MTGGPGPFEVRGASPTGRLDVAPRQLARGHFAVDPPAGSVTWIPVVKRRPPLVMRLPGRGDPALPELRRVVVMTSVTSSSGEVRELVLVDGAGHSLATTPPTQTVNFDKVWRPGTLDPLGLVDIEVAYETARFQRQVEQRYPGAARHWMFTTPGWILLPVLAFVVVVAAICVALLLIFVG